MAQFCLKYTKHYTMKRINVFILATALSVITFAQDKKVDISINKDSGGGNWYASPWVWIVGVAVFILLLVALLRGRNAD